MEQKTLEVKDGQYTSTSKTKELGNQKVCSREFNPGNELWKDGLICAFEFSRGRRKLTNVRSQGKFPPRQQMDVEHSRMQSPKNRSMDNSRLLSSSLTNFKEGHIPLSPIVDDSERESHQLVQCDVSEHSEGSKWVPIGWARISELVQMIQVGSDWASQQFQISEDDDDLTAADLATPYWERPAGPIWWCHVAAGHPNIAAWLSNAQWLHPAVSLALRDESRLISERMKHLLYEVPVRVAGGILFELLGQSVGDPFVNEDDVPIVLRSWQAQNFLVTSMHVKGTVSSVNVLGITEVQEVLSAGGYNVPRTVHEVIGLLACRLSRWDDRLFRKSIFGAADEIELKFMNRRNHEDLNLFSIILNQEIRKLSKQVIRVKWSLHAREEIVFELLQHLRGMGARTLLEGIKKSTREMIEEQEAVRGRLFTIQDVLQSNVRAWLQDKSLRVTHNLGVFGGCGLVLTIVTGLFGINVDGIPGAQNTPYAFGLFTGILVFIGVVLVVIGLIYLGLKRPISEEQVEVRKLELQELVKMFQHEAETHAQVRDNISRNNLPPTAGDNFPYDADYVLIG